MIEKDFSKTIQLMRQAGYACIHVISKEEKVVDEEIFNALKDNPNIDKILRFSVASAVQELTKPGGKYKPYHKCTDVEELVASMPAMMQKDPEKDAKKTSVMILPDFHEYLMKDPIIRRSFRERIWWCRAAGHGLILISNQYHEIPDLGNDITVVYHGLPSREMTESMVDGMFKDYEIEQPPGEERERIIESLTGLTYVAQEDSMSLGIADAKIRKAAKIDYKILQENKEREIAKKGFLQILKPNVTFKDVVGHQSLKDWVKVRRKGFTKAAIEFGITEPPRGMLLTGVPGVGKTLFAKALANEWNLPLLQFKVGSAFSSMLGETEANVKNACEIAEKMAPCLFFVDEVNRAFGGSSGESDGGTSQRILGELLNWLSERTAPVFTLCTANDVSKMPAELLRKGRLDELWGVGLPSFEERCGIFNLYLNREHSVDIEAVSSRTDRFVPSEIKEIVRGSVFRAFERFEDSKKKDDAIVRQEDVMEEIERTVPLSTSMADQFKFLEDWSDKNCRSTRYESKIEKSIDQKEIGIGDRRYINDS